MEKPNKNIYRNDLILQGVVYLPMLFCYTMSFIMKSFFFFGLVLQILVGLIQVGSGTYYVLKFEEKVHKKYLSIALPYTLFIIILSNLFKVPSFLIIFMFIVIPTGIASWYFYMTYKNHKNANEYSNTEFQEDILDDNML